MSKKEKNAQTILRKESVIESAPKVIDATMTRFQTASNTPRVSESFITELTNCPVYIRNADFPFSKELYPHQPSLRCCDRYYPTAKGGPLFIDEPKSDGVNLVHDLENCEIKKKFFKERGLRYLVVTRETDELNAMEQLGLA